MEKTREPSVEVSMFKRIMAAVDGSESSRKASEVALDVAGKYKAELHVLYAINPPIPSIAYSFPSMTPPTPSQAEIDAYYANAKKAAMAIVGQTVSEAQRRGINAEPEIPEATLSVVETIVNHAASDKVDLIVIGSRGLGGFKKLLLGSVSSGVVTHAPCPVLVVR